jgi:hypothetical protein
MVENSLSSRLVTRETSSGGDGITLTPLATPSGPDDGLISVWDSSPEDLQVPCLTAWIVAYRRFLGETAAWCEEYRRRAEERDMKASAAARDRGMLETLLFLMEREGTRLFHASSKDLILHGGAHQRTVVDAIRRLRKLSYLACLGPTIWRDGDCRIYRYALLTTPGMCESDLSEVPNASVSVPPPLLAGDYASDAFAGHRGFNPNRRQVYTWYRANQGRTRYACHKATGVPHNTVGRAVEWLIEQGLAAQDAEERIYVFETTDHRKVCEDIAARNRTVGKSATRLEHMNRPWWEIQRIQEQRKNRSGRVLPSVERLEAERAVRAAVRHSAPTAAGRFATPATTDQPVRS